MSDTNEVIRRFNDAFVHHDPGQLDVLVGEELLAGEEAGDHPIPAVGPAMRGHRAGVLDEHHVRVQHIAQVRLGGGQVGDDGEVGADGLGWGPAHLPTVASPRPPGRGIGERHGARQYPEPESGSVGVCRRAGLEHLLAA